MLRRKSLVAASACLLLAPAAAQVYPASPTVSGIPAALPKKTAPVNPIACDEKSSYEAGRDPHDARRRFEQAFKRYPTRKVMGTCGDVDGFPSSIARPALFQTPMFTDRAGDEAENDAARDLRVVQSYNETSHMLDVYETITLKQSAVDLFIGSRTNPNKNEGFLDSCRPTDYRFTGIWAYSTPTNGENTPGPTHRNCVGRQSVLRFCSEVTRPTAVHLHGAASVSPYDGWADNSQGKGQCKDYFYPNSASRSLWYHDHAVGITADNDHAGLAGQYIVNQCHDPVETNYLPHTKYTLPLTLKENVLGKKLLANGEGALVYNGGKLNKGSASSHKENLYGDIMTVNGKPWPYHKVEKRTYRFNLVNAGPSRAYSIKMIAESADGTVQEWVDFYMIGGDGGMLRGARKLNHLLSEVGARYDLVLDFSARGMPKVLNAAKPWAHVYLVNDFGRDMDSHAPPLFCKSHLLARFDLIAKKENPLFDRDIDKPGQYPPPLARGPTVNKGLLCDHDGLRNLISNTDFAEQKQRAINREADRVLDFGKAGRRRLQEGMVGFPTGDPSGSVIGGALNPQNPWGISGVQWEDEEKKINANPQRDGIELWHIEGHGGWYHPIHVHLIDHVLLYGTGRESDLYADWDALRGSKGVFNSLDPFGCSSDDDCAGSTCNAQKQCVMKPCGTDINCPLGTYCIANACVANGLRDWEQDVPKDVHHLGPSHNTWFTARFGPHDGDYMYHCHNIVHEDSSMMVAFRTGGESPDAPEKWDPSVGAGAHPGDMKFAIKPDMKETKMNMWHPAVYRTKFKPEFNSDNTFSPYSNQYRTGKVDEHTRDSEEFDALAQAGLPDQTSAAYYCNRAREGFYDVFYPPQTGNALVIQLALREPAELGNDVSPYDTDNEPGAAFHNPVQNNIWAFDYTQPKVQWIPGAGAAGDNNKDLFIKRAAGWQTRTCADVDPLNAVIPVECEDDMECAIDPDAPIGSVCFSKTTKLCAVLGPGECVEDHHCTSSFMMNEKCNSLGLCAAEPESEHGDDNSVDKLVVPVTRRVRGAAEPAAVAVNADGSQGV